MPNAPQTRRKDSAGTSKTENSQQIIDLFGFIGLHQLGTVADCLLAGPGQKGRRSPYPATALLGTVTAARATGSQAEALKAMRQPHTWAQCRENYYKRSKQLSKDGEGVWLPATPPNRDQVRYFRKLLEANPAVLEALQELFQRLAIGQARSLGNLLPGMVADGAHPSEPNAIYSDGTLIDAFSDVRVVIHPRTKQEILIGSRAQCKETARIQRVVTSTSEDGKNGYGLNMVSVHTWTPAGRVVLGTGTALRAEQWAVLDLIDSIAGILATLDGPEDDGAIHTLINDRAITGWAVDYLMAQHGMQVLSKAVGRNGSTNDSDIEVSDTDLKGRVSRLAAEYDVSPTSLQGQILRRDVLADMIRYHDKLPVGLSLYPTKKHGFDLVHSKVLDLPPAVHTTPDGPCEHRLVVDDGALFLVEDHPEEGCEVKSRLLPCERSDRIRRPDGRRGTRNRYTVPCAAGDFEYVRTWEPAGTRYTPDSEEKDRAPKDRIGWQLRPLNRADDIVEWYNHDVPMHQISRLRFSDMFSRRNDAEAYNQWYQQSLPHHGRAASESIAMQELDFLLAGLLNNSITWHNHKR